jgi:hypothetical protein
MANEKTMQQLAKEAFEQIKPPITTPGQVSALINALWFTCKDEDRPAEELVRDLALLSGMSVATLRDYALLLEQRETA